MNDHSKHVYIFGNKFLGFYGHTYDKEIAKGIKKHRKDLKCYKIKNDEYCKANLSINTEFIEPYEDLFLTAIEETDMFDAFTQYESDALFFIDSLKKKCKYLKWSNKEEKIINYFIGFLLVYKKYILEDQYEDDNIEKVYDDRAILKYYIETIIGGNGD